MGGTKILFKKDFVDLCEKHSINWIQIEENAVMDLFFALESKKDKKADREFETLLSKYGYGR